MPNHADLDARLDAIAAQLPRFRRDFEQVFADLTDRAEPPNPATTAAPDLQQPSERPDATVDRVTRH